MSIRSPRKKMVSFLWMLGLLFIIYCFPKTVLSFLIMVAVCGAYDFLRNGIYTAELARKYFLGSGRNTWVLSPFNTLFDLVSRPNRGIYQMKDLPADCQRDLQQVIDNAMSHKDKIIQYLDGRMAQSKRGMLFFQWYGRKIDTELDIKTLQKKFPYVKTVGVSVFNENQSTSFHFGPLRMMFRVLYNMEPAPYHDGVYIQCRKQKHFWHDNPLFIFDDTLLHASFNKNDSKRYCLFIDIVRPSYIPIILNGAIAGFAGIAFVLRRMFYKNWKFIK